MADVAMTRQVDRAVDLVFGEQSAKGTLAAANSGVRIPFATYNKIEYNQTRTADPRNRKNGMSGASKLARTNYALNGVQGPLMVNAYDLLLQAAQRESFTAEAEIDQTDISQLQSMTTAGLATFTASPISAGVRVGQFHEYSVGLAAADMGVPLLVTAVTSTTIQYALPRHGAFTAVGSAADFTLAIKKNAPNAAERWPFTIEDRSENRDFSEMLDFTLLQRMVLQAAGQGPANLTFDFLALAFSKKEDSNSPHFTTIASSTNDFIIAPELRFNINGTWVNYEEVSFTWDLRSFTDNTNATTPVDGAHGSTVMTGNFTILDDATAEDTFDDAIADTWGYVAVEGIDADGKFIGFFWPRVKFTQPGGSSKGEDRFSNRTFVLEIAEDERGGAYPNTMCLVSSDTAA